MMKLTLWLHSHRTAGRSRGDERRRRHPATSKARNRSVLGRHQRITSRQVRKPTHIGASHKAVSPRYSAGP